jgi:hypothetical protein
MKVYGYDLADEDAESPMELREVTLSVTLADIDQLMAFLRDARDGFSAGKPRPGHAHSHFSHWLPSWSPSQADVILVYEAPSSPDGHA